MKDIYNATDLYEEEIDDFKCPSCRERLYLIITQPPINDCICATCKSCRSFINIKIPTVKKKLIYLDQWFVSNITDDIKSDYYTSLIDKLAELVHIQKVFIVTSSIHAKETSKIPITEKQKIIWEKFNSLSIGQIADDSIYESQYKRVLFKQEECFPWEDMLTENPHNWIIASNISSTVRAHLMMNNTGLLRLYEQVDPSSELVNVQLRSDLDNQCKAMSKDSTIQDCYEYIKRLWIEGMQGGIDFYEKQKYFLSNPEKFDINSLYLLHNHSGSEFYQTIRFIVDKCTNYGAESCEDDVITLLKATTELPRRSLLGIAFEAQQLYSALQAYYTTGITENKKKFSRKYGVSNQNDVSHISSFCPYVDILLTDNKARERLAQPPVKECLFDLNCVFYSDNNIQEFEDYLDSLLVESESPEQEKARRLLVGRTKKEQKDSFDKVFQEVLDGLLSKQ